MSFFTIAEATRARYEGEAIELPRKGGLEKKPAANFILRQAVPIIFKL